MRRQGHDRPEGEHSRGEEQHPRSTSAGQRADGDGAVGPGQRGPDRGPDPERHEHRVEDDPRDHAGDEEVDPDPAQDAAQLGCGQGSLLDLRRGCRRVADAGKVEQGHAETGHPTNPVLGPVRPDSVGAGPAAGSSYRTKRRPFRPADACPWLRSPLSPNMGLVELTESFAWEGRRIAWARAGSGPAVVFCHGTPFSSRVWAPYAEALADRFTVHLWDLPGLRPVVDGPGAPGRRRRPRPGVPGAARPLGARPSSGRRPRPRRAGVAARAPGRGSGVRLAVPGRRRGDPAQRIAVLPVRPGQPGAARPSSRRTSTRRSSGPTSATRPIAGSRPRTSTHSWSRGPASDGPARVLPADRRLRRRRCSTRTSDRLAELDLPVRILWGTEDAWIPLETGRRFAGLIPGAVLTEVPDAGHLMQYDAPVALATALRDWLDATA